jgi:hypothetical protein
MINFTTEDDDTMEAMNEDDIYRYLRHRQSKQIKHAQKKQKLGEEYLNRTKSIWKIKLSGKNTIKAINTYATPVLTFRFGIVKWTPTALGKGTGKAVPLQAWSGPGGFRKLKFSYFMTTAQDGDKVVSLTHRSPLSPGNTPGNHFCYRLSRPQGHSATGRCMSLKNSSETIGNRTRDLPVCSAVP